ncbi:TonB family protein [Ekhidna sp.]|uniref:TonB family protein n=1 Tax=Ekhidna sp. TaxID=2608089 RepID=UPI003B505947
MKKIFSIVALAFFVLNTFATPSNGEAENPKPTNYKEIISNIEYPESSKAKGIEGQVLVMLKIDKAGKVINHRFEDYPCTDLRDAVKDILKDLKFEPAKNSKGESVVGFIAVPVNFKLTI